MRIFIICGTCGEYSDRSEWLVAAYTDETKDPMCMGSFLLTAF